MIDIKRVIIIISVCLLLGALCLAWIYPCARQGLFKIEQGQNLFQIAENLKSEGFIRAEFPFSAYVMYKQKEKDLKYGVYQFSRIDNVLSIADKIIKGETYTIKVTIPEGFNVKQIDEKLAQNQLIEPGDLDPKYEGFFFPDTYYFFPSESVEEITQKFLDNFDKKLSPELRREIKQQSKTIFEIITMASLLEKEVQGFEDKRIVSGILWKRLEVNMPLQVDATITYITGKKTTKISIEDTKIDSPYNTYKNRGLPIGPICNPGLESIKAAIYPEPSDYWYYISTPEGKTVFSKTLKEHNANIAKYLQ